MSNGDLESIRKLSPRPGFAGRGAGGEGFLVTQRERLAMTGTNGRNECWERNRRRETRLLFATRVADNAEILVGKESGQANAESRDLTTSESFQHLQHLPIPHASESFALEKAIGSV